MTKVNAQATGLALAGVLALSGCISVLPEPTPAPRIFPLRAPAVAPASNPADLVIAAPPPVMAAALAGPEIVWINEGALGFMDRGVWPERAPQALQTLLVETIDAQDLVKAAVRAGDGARADVELRWQVNDFQIVEAAGQVEAVFMADVKLMDGRTRTIIAATRVSKKEPISDRSAALAAAALQRAAQAAATEIGAWAAGAAQSRPTISP